MGTNKQNEVRNHTTPSYQIFSLILMLFFNFNCRLNGDSPPDVCFFGLNFKAKITYQFDRRIRIYDTFLFSYDYINKNREYGFQTASLQEALIGAFKTAVLEVSCYDPPDVSEATS